MTRPAPSSKVVLLEDRRGGSAAPGGAQVRRYRLARLRFDGQVAPESSRFEYLKRSYDQAQAYRVCLTARYAVMMSNEVEVQRTHSPVVRRAVAGVVLVVAVALAIKLVVGFLAAIFWTVVGVALVVAILWALKTIFW